MNNAKEAVRRKYFFANNLSIKREILDLQRFILGKKASERLGDLKHNTTTHDRQPGRQKQQN